MLQGRIFKLIKEKIGEYLYGFKQEQLDVGLFSGRIQLENLTLKHDKINENPALQNSPIAIKAGMLGLLQVNVTDHARTTQLMFMFDRSNILI